MSFSSDPYQTLGLPRGATLAQVKQAYRRLAKQFHPDSAGERALPRFLAIQAAYELIVSPRERTAGSAPGSAAAAGRPWQADPTRARATRDAYRDRARRARPGPSQGPADGTAASSGARPGSTARDDAPPRPGGRSRPEPDARSAPGRASGASRPGGRPGGRKRPSRKATLGSTSYDDAAGEPFDPAWEGAGWYGASSGTYWTLNPKEYADPRKHGPEYQARARRATRGDENGEGAGDPIEREWPARPAAATSGAIGADWTWSAPREETAPPPPRSTARSSRPPGDRATPARSRATSAEPATHAAPPPAGPAAAPAASLHPPGVAPGLLGSRWADRVLLAVIGWPPLGLAVMGLVNELSGCGRFAATCSPDSSAPLTAGSWLAQPLILGLLLAVPLLGRISAAGTVAVIATAVPAALVLAPGSWRDPGASSAALILVLVIAWLAGAALAASGRFDLPGRLSRRVP